MDRLDAAQDTKLRWTVTPSEEQLLGSPLLASSPPTVSFQPPAPHDWAVPDVVVPVADSPVAHPRWRPQARDLIALTAVAAAVWFAVRGADGVPFRSTDSVPPTTANVTTTHVLTDRQELSSLAREVKATATAAGATEGNHKQGGKHGSGSSGSGKGNDESPAGGDDSTAPLVRATIPGVGSVTVEHPDLPDTSALPVPNLPDAEITGPGTVTATLP